MPAQEIENLYEGELTTTSTKVYTVPAGLQVNVTSIQLVNITSTSATARVDRVPSGGSDGTTDEVFNGAVAANSTVGALAEPLALEAGDELYVSAGTATAIDCTISAEVSDI